MALPLLIGNSARSVIILITMDYKLDPEIFEALQVQIDTAELLSSIFNYQFKDCFIKSWLDMQKNLK